MRNRKTQGFTLIELLIVIAIIGILAAVLIPNLMQARRAAGTRAAQSHMSNVYTAVNAYLAEHVQFDEANLTTLTCAPGYDAEGAGEYIVNAVGANIVSSCSITPPAAAGDILFVTITLGSGTTQPATTLSIPAQASDTFVQ